MNTNKTTDEIVPTWFHTIMADPPWDIGQKEGCYGANKHYDLMTLERIKKLPVADLAEDNVHLYLWEIHGAIREGIDIMEVWGFTYRAPVKFRGQGTWLYAPVQEHSLKPEEQYAVIERLPDGPYLEFFARRHQPGWSAWGNKITVGIGMPGYSVPSDNRSRGEVSP
jgi:N6-adenosine-specific RNA methylase IME4